MIRSTGMRRTISGFIFGSLFISFLFVIPVNTIPSASAQENPQTQFNFHFPENSKEMEVGPGDPMQVVFDGTIELLHWIPQARQVVVSLRVDTVYDETFSERASRNTWIASVSPVIVFLDPANKVVPIHVVVKASYGENTDVHYRIVLSGTWQANPGDEGDVEPYELFSHTIQFYNIQVSASHAFTTGFPGETRLYTLTIMNQGNGEDYYEVSVEDEVWKKHLEPRGWIIEMPYETTELVLPDETVNFTFKVHGPLDRWPDIWTTRVSSINLIIESAAAKDAGFYDTDGRSQEFRRYAVYYQEKGTRYDLEPCLVIMMLPVVLILAVNLILTARWRIERWKRENLP